MTIKMHNAETGEIIEREMNADELKQWNKDKANAEAELANETKMASDKAAATAKLEALGLTSNDLKALGL